MGSALGAGGGGFIGEWGGDEDAVILSWVSSVFLRFVRPKKYFQVQAEDVEEYLHKLVAEGKQNWQVRQAAEALRVFYQQEDLVKWATP
jgi:acetylglutamate kinase